VLVQLAPAADRAVQVPRQQDAPQETLRQVPFEHSSLDTQAPPTETVPLRSVAHVPELSTVVSEDEPLREQPAVAKAPKQVAALLAS
jgi:hypothetical protein